MSATKESKIRPGEFKFQPGADWIVIDKIDILSKMDKAAKRVNLNLVGAPSPKNLLEAEKKAASEYMTYVDYTKNALDVYDGKHGWQGVIKAIGPTVPVELGYKVGQKVYYRGNTGEPMIHNKRLFWMMKAHELFGWAPRNEHDI
jgi:hypothetical protein